MNSNKSLEIDEVVDQFIVNFQVDWLRKFQGTYVITFSSYGWCKTFNIVDDSELFHENSTAQYFRHQPTNKLELIGSIYSLAMNPQNSPLFTAQSDFGVHAFVFDSDNTTFVIHSPYEIPDSRHKRFQLSDYEVAKLSIEPIIRITDNNLKQNYYKNIKNCPFRLN